MVPHPQEKAPQTQTQTYYYFSILLYSIKDFMQHLELSTQF